MGAKSTNVYSTKQMLPLFQVISDLERPYASTDASLRTPNSRSLASDVIAEVVSSGGRHLDESLLSGHFDCLGIAPEGGAFKMEDAARDGKGVSRKTHRRYHHHKHKDEKHRSRKAKSRKPHAARNEERQTSEDCSSSGRRKLGLFTSMGLSLYPSDDVDLSRHFKDLTQQDFDSEVVEHSDCPTYEVPKDVVGRRALRGRGRSVSEERGGEWESEGAEENAVSSSRVSRLSEGVGRLSSKQIVGRYEEMLEMLLQKNQQKDLIIQKRDRHMLKMKSKLKLLLRCNAQFADENDQLRSVAGEMKERLEAAGVNQANSGRVYEDLSMLKNVVYRLNVQLSRYQEKLRRVALSNDKPTTTTQIQNDGHDSASNAQDRRASGNEMSEGVSIPSIPVFTDAILNEDGSKKDSVKRNSSDDGNAACWGQAKAEYEGRLVWGDVNTHTLAPLLNAYQESLAEKDDLIRDYEREFNRFAAKLRLVLAENESLGARAGRLGGRAAQADRELQKLKQDKQQQQDTQQAMEHKVESMSRDYNLLHQEYSRLRSALAAAQGRALALETRLAQQQPSNNTTDKCQGLLEELKNRYDSERVRMTARLADMREVAAQQDKRIAELNTLHCGLEEKIRARDKVIRRGRRSASGLRAELVAARAGRSLLQRRATRATQLARQLAQQLHAARHKNEVQQLRGVAEQKKSVQKDALKELDAVEVRIREQNHQLRQAASEGAAREELLRQQGATIQALKSHINKDRLPRFHDDRQSAHSVPRELARAVSLTRVTTDAGAVKGRTRILTTVARKPPPQMKA